MDALLHRSDHKLMVCELLGWHGLGGCAVGRAGIASQETLHNASQLYGRLAVVLWTPSGRPGGALSDRAACLRPYCATKST